LCEIRVYTDDHAVAIRFHLAGPFIPASGLALDHEWRFFGGANDSERP